MRPHPFSVAVLLAAALQVHAQEAPPAPEIASLPVTRVVLFSSGVGYFEHEGTVEGDASMQLLFKAAQINDVLKSMVLMDFNGGRVGSVSYPSQEPVERALSSFGVNLSGNPSLPDMLNQLRGARVTVATPDPVRGAILNVTSRTRVFGEPAAQVTEHVLNLVTEHGIVALPLDSVQRLELEDAQLREELSKALGLLAESRDTDRRPVELRFEGQGTRRVRVGYLVETPVWKTSYRLDLGGASEGAAKPQAAEGGEDEAFLQGWAIVENTSESDWSDVTLSLMSGQPMSFAMDLYTPLYVPRPTAQVPRYASLMPRVYEEGFIENELAPLEAKAAVLGDRPMVGRRRVAGADGGRQMAQQLQPMAGNPAVAQFGVVSGGVVSIASGENVAELFRFTIDRPVDLARRRSAMLPIVSEAVKAEKLSIYNQTVLRDRPLHGAKLTNSTKLKLLGGPVTVFDGGAYAGDALIDHLGAGEDRLLSYGIDLDVTVDPSASSTNDIVDAQIVKGVLRINRRFTFDQTYKLKNKAGSPKTLLIEHPTGPRRELLEPKAYDEKTPNLYRFRLELPPAKEVSFLVREQEPQWEALAILDIQIDQLQAYVKNGRIDEKVREALERAATMKIELARLETTLNERQAEQNGIKQGQERLRENLKTVRQDSQLGQRYLAKLSSEEDRIEQLDAEIAELRTKIDEQRRALQDYLRGLNVE